MGCTGDVKAVGNGVIEMRIHHGPDYHVYFLHESGTVVILCDGNKDSQKRDIDCAGKLVRDWKLK